MRKEPRPRRLVLNAGRPMCGPNRGALHSLQTVLPEGRLFPLQSPVVGEPGNAASLHEVPNLVVSGVQLGPIGPLDLHQQLPWTSVLGYDYLVFPEVGANRGESPVIFCAEPSFRSIP